MKSDQHPLIAINKKTLDIHNKQTGRHLTAIPSPQGVAAAAPTFRQDTTDMNH